MEIVHAIAPQVMATSTTVKKTTSRMPPTIGCAAGWTAPTSRTDEGGWAAIVDTGCVWRERCGARGHFDPC